MSMQQLQAVKQGGPFVQVTVPVPKPGPDEICVRSKAVSLNAIDWKNLKFGALVQSWPTVLGIEGAGIVESVGDDVSYFKPGDEVMAWLQRTDTNGAFQDVYKVKELTVAKKPKGLAFEEASSLPICFLTGAATIMAGLKVPIPGLSRKDAPTSHLRSVIVLGGSSGVGSAAIQLLRTALPAAVIITTSSIAHHETLKALGASTCLERAAQSDPAVIKAATIDGLGVDAIIDVVGALHDDPAVFDAFRADGPKLYSLVITRPGAEFPEGVKGTLVGGQDTLNMEPKAMKYLTSLVEDGKYALPKTEVVGSGYQAIIDGVERVPQVSGKKLIVTL